MKKERKVNMKHNEHPRVVVIGGGTGMPVLLRGLKNLPVHLTALVTVADDGGSTGKIRKDMSIPAPGDIRNVIAALSDAEPILLDLFQHRFATGNGLSGHSMGNLLLAAMTSVTGDFYTGIKEISRVLNVKGDIFPISNENLTLHARMEDGTIVSGESNIPLANQKIERVFLSPENIQPMSHAVEAIKKAELIVISPGSLYTSILPNLIIPGIGSALKHTLGKVVYVCNIMTQKGETTGYTAADHVKAIFDHIGRETVDSVIVHSEPVDESLLEIYAKEGSEPVINDMERLQAMSIEVVKGDIIDHSQTAVRHDTKKLSSLLYSMFAS